MLKMVLAVSLMASQLVASDSHAPRAQTHQEAIDRVRQRVIARGDLPYVSVEEQLELIEQLDQFDLGRFLLEHGGLNGYWTHYVVTHPETGRLSGLNNAGRPFTALEAFMLDQAPTAVATQQRFQIFKQQIQRRVGDGVALASIPSGMMDELLDLDYSRVVGVTRVGIDLDPETLAQAAQLARERGLKSEFIQQDAWEIKSDQQFDLIASSGLTIYIRDDERVRNLYRIFFRALKPGGILVTSFLTPPPVPNEQTEWDLSKVDQDAALLQKILFVDILDAGWRAYRPEATVVDQLKSTGFVDLQVIYDQAHIFPTVIARRPSV